MIGPKTVEEMIGQANNLGAMQASAIWALVSTMLAIYIWRIQKHHDTYDKQWQEIRIKEAEGDIRISEAVKAQSEAIVRLHEQVSEIRIIVCIDF